jgi:hypothetical protein
MYGSPGFPVNNRRCRTLGKYRHTGILEMKKVKALVVTLEVLFVESCFKMDGIFMVSSEIGRGQKFKTH